MKSKVNRRETLAKRIARARTIPEKYSVALGMDEISHHWPPDDGSLESVYRIIGHCMTPTQRAQGRPVMRATTPKIEHLGGLGVLFARLIVEGDHKFFQRLAAALQYPPRRESPHWLYIRTLAYCRTTQSGTMANPCDRKALLRFLRDWGHTLKDDRGNGSRVLWATCKKLGVILR